MEFQSLTGGGSVLWLKSSRCRSNVNKVVHDFYPHIMETSATLALVSSCCSSSLVTKTEAHVEWLKSWNICPAAVLCTISVSDFTFF